MPHPKVSVVIPAYNSAAFLGEALDSVLGQTFQDFEVVVVNDGSRDNTQGIIEGYIKKYPSQIRAFFQENRGSPAAKNRGIQEAQGEYVAFLDSDDLWMKDKLEIQLSEMNKDKDLSLVFGSMVFRGDPNREGKIMPTVPAVNFHELYINGGMIPFSTVLVKRNVFEELGYFDEQLKIIHDFDYWLRLLRKRKAFFVNKVVGIYRVHASNSVHNVERWKSEGVQVFEKLLRDTSLDQRQVHRRIALEHYFLFRFYFQKKDYGKALKHFSRMIKHDPWAGLAISTNAPAWLKPFAAIKPYFAIIFLAILAGFNQLRNSISGKRICY